MWKRHWGLSREPFHDDRSPFVAIPSHQEAASRLAYTIESGQRLGLIRAAAGLGKSKVVAHVITNSRQAGRRIAPAYYPFHGVDLWHTLADRLGAPAAAIRDDRAASWRRLERAVQVCSLEGRRVILVVDNADALWKEPEREDLLRLCQLGGGSVTVLLAVRDGDDEPEPALPWALTIGLARLTRSEVERYLAEKLAAAGCGDPVFTPPAIVRLHALCSGVPRGLDRLASLALMAAASRGLEAVSSEVVDGAARECQVPASGLGVAVRRTGRAG